MTQKEILKIAANEDTMDILKEIAFIQRNMCNKTVYEQKSAKAQMKKLVKELLESISE